MDDEFPRQLTKAEANLLTCLLTKLLPAQCHYVGQLTDSVVVSKCPCGCPTINLWAEGKLAPPESEARVFWQGKGHTAKGEPVGILLFETAGRLSCFEVWGHGDEVLADLPLPGSIEECHPTSNA